MDFHTKVAGVTFNNRQRVCRKLEIGQKLLLIREPTNPYDGNAVAVFTENREQVGYIGAAYAGDISIAIQRGIHYYAIVTAVTGGGADNYGVNIRVIST